MYEKSVDGGDLEQSCGVWMFGASYASMQFLCFIDGQFSWGKYDRSSTFESGNVKVSHKRPFSPT